MALPTRTIFAPHSMAVSKSPLIPIDKVCLIHSVDSIKLMDEIERQAEKHNLDMDILIQVNISGEETKSGISKEEVEDLLKYAGKLKHVKVKGLMTIAPKTDNYVTNKLHFDNMRQLFVDIKQKKYDNVNMVYLSMGMSGDFDTRVFFVFCLFFIIIVVIIIIVFTFKA